MSKPEPRKNTIHNALYMSLLMVALCTLTFRLPAQSIVHIPRAGSPPVIDGQAELTWESIDFSTIDHIYGGSISGSSDLSAGWKAMWDDANIYFLIRVTDDSLFNLGAGATKYWIHDCAEIFFDVLNDKDLVGTDESPDDDNYQYRFIWNLDKEPIVEGPPAEGLINASYTLIDGTDTTGYHIEIVIPWGTLIQDHNFGTVEKGKQVGLEVKIADLDRSTVPSGIWAPDAELLWNNPTTENLKQSAMFGTIQLVQSVQGDDLPPSIISDLSGAATGSRSVSLQWSAPGDENTGRVAGYELGISPDSMTLIQWNGSTLVTVPGIPFMPGMGEIFSMDTLDPGTQYYFAMRSRDAFNNLSPLSNIILLSTFDPDDIAPAGVTDLAIDSSSAFMAEFTWTATGDDGNTGTASGYDIRYLHESITAENWESAIKAEDLPVPLEAGSKQSFTLHGLQPEKTYYFGIRVLDETPNYSELSNVVELTTPSFTYTVKNSVDQMIGTNSFIDVPMDKMEAVGFIREYHPWSFTEIEDDAFEFNRWNGFWDFDKYYTQLHSRGITVCPALWSSPDWLESNSTNKPVGDLEDPEDPASYSEMAQFVYQYAARYGNNPVDEDKLIVNTGQVKKTGLGLISYYEDWNEQDRDWEGREAQFYASEYAAMASANVDGHGGLLGDGYGLKTADPSAKFVMGGLYILGTGYISDMYQWFKKNRPDNRWPIDVINMHHYSYSYEKNGISPEEDGYKEKILEVMEWRNEFAPENEVWITEFGYDTNDESPNRINPFAGFTQEEIQAQWIVRTFLLMTSAGVDRAAQFMIRDVGEDPEPRWRDSGLTGSDADGYVPKVSWYYVYSLKNIMKEMYFDRVVSENNSAYVYRYKNQSGDKFVYALWSPTGDGSASNYRLKIPENPTSLQKIELTDGSTEGTTTDLDTGSGQISVDITETPQFIVAGYGEPSSDQAYLTAPGCTVYPNPFTSQLGLKFSRGDKSSDIRIRIYGADGKMQKDLSLQNPGNALSLELGDLERGFYIMEATLGNQIYTKKLLKE